ANAGMKRMTKAAEEAVQTVNQGGSSQSVLLINTRKSGELFVCEMSLCKNQHPTTGWYYHAGIQRDVSDRISVETLLKAASEGISYDEICRKWRTSTVLAEKLGSSQQDLHSIAEQMWKDELSKVFKKKDSAKTTAPDTDMRSVWSRSTASTMHSHRSRSSRNDSTKGDSEQKIHHLGALFGTVISSDSSAEEKEKAEKSEKSEKSEESGRFLDLLEGEFSDDEGDCDGKAVSPVHAPPVTMDLAPPPLSIEGLRQRDMEEHVSLKSWQSEEFKSVSDQSEHDEECGTLSTEDNSPVSDTSLICDEVQDPAKHVSGRIVLRNLDIPLVIAAPTMTGFPVVLRSQGFEDLAGPSLQVKMGTQAKHSLQPSNARAQSIWADFCESAVRGHFFVHPGTGGGIAILEGMGDITLPSGELAFVQPFHGRFGNVIDCERPSLWVELDDCPYLLALHSYLPQLDTDMEKDRLRLLDSEFYKVGMRLDEVISELASEFFYYAPMRRQNTLYPRREQTCQDHALLDLLVHEL
ncbi:unnamed protein product, partial [Symbiodinium pilosum]